MTIHRAGQAVHQLGEEFKQLSRNDPKKLPAELRPLSETGNQLNTMLSQLNQVAVRSVQGEPWRPEQLREFHRRLTELDAQLVVPEAYKERLGQTVSTLRSRLGDVRDALTNAQDLATRPQLITDFLGYNAGIELGDGEDPIFFRGAGHWVGDLMLDFEVEVTRVDAGGQLILELVEGVDTHRAVFDLQTGRCTLLITRDGQELKRAEADTKLQGTGRRRVRFANFDNRLTVWVDGRLPFGDGLPFDLTPADEQGPRLADLRPAAVAARSAGVTIRHLQLWRDIYYTQTTAHDFDLGHRNPAETLGFSPADLQKMQQEGLTKLTAAEHKLSEAQRLRLAAQRFKPDNWKYYDQKPKSYDVPEGEYFALGDNSTESSDSREWGTVPERLLLGKAVWVYWPLGRFGLIK
jgi:signal peptidase I